MSCVIFALGQLILRTNPREKIKGSTSSEVVDINSLHELEGKARMRLIASPHSVELQLLSGPGKSNRKAVDSLSLFVQHWTSIEV